MSQFKIASVVCTSTLFAKINVQGNNVSATIVITEIGTGSSKQTAAKKEYNSQKKISLPLASSMSQSTVMIPRRSDISRQLLVVKLFC